MLQKLGLHPHRSLEDDLTLQSAAMSYGGSTRTVSLPAGPLATSLPTQTQKIAVPSAGNGQKTVAARVDFAKMSAQERLAYHQARLNRLFGESR